METIADSKEVGLAIGQILGSELFGFEDLHYGYWDAALSVNLRNFAEAQERYSQFLIGQIPAGVRTILDVGAGSGKQAERLLDRGFVVDCVSPSRYLSVKIEQRVGERARLFRSRIEELEITRAYDLVLFSESFQYVEMRTALEAACSALVPGGYILVCDFFKKKLEGPLGGGHLLVEFVATLKRFPLTIVRDDDITAATAPTIEMFGKILESTAKPVRDLVCGFIRERHPTLYQFLAWKFKGRLRKIESKYFAGQLSESTFQEFKTYRCVLLQKSAHC